MKRIFILVILVTANAVFAESKDSDKVDLKSLEDKYWAAKDDDFSVVQNRAYAKENRFFGTIEGGIPINDPYSSGNATSLGVGYHWNERMGVSLVQGSTAYKDNDATSQFITDHGTIPNHNILRSTMTLQYHYIPFYAKMSFLDKKIVYFDMGVTFGLGQTNYEQQINTGNKSQTGTHTSFELYQNFFINEHFAIKVSYKNFWTNEERMRYKLNVGEAESARSLGVKSINDTQLLLGLTFYK